MMNHPIDCRRTDRAFLHRQQLMGRKPVIAEDKLSAGAQLHSCAIAVIPRFGGVRNNVLLPLEFSSAAKRLAQNGALDLQLVLIIGVLIVATAASCKVRALRLKAPFGSFKQLIQRGAAEPWP